MEDMAFWCELLGVEWIGFDDYNPDDGTIDFDVLDVPVQ